MEDEKKEILSELETAESAAERAESAMALGDIGAENDAVALKDANSAAVEIDEPLDAKARTLSPTVLLLKRFFRSKLSITGLVIIIVLFLFSYLGPFIFNQWGETQADISGKETVEVVTVEVTTPDGETITVTQVLVTKEADNSLAAPSLKHWLGTDKSGYDVFTRCMYGGRISLLVSLIVVILETFLGIVLGGLAGYFGKWVDQLIMRIVDIFQCIPTLPILLIVGTVLNGIDSVPQQYRIYYLMGFLTLLGWAGTARIVRGQILSLREQEFMTAAEAMGLSTSRKIFKHLIPNVMPQLIVSMTLGLGGTILYESSLSYLGLGVQAPFAAWGTMINIIVEDPHVIANNWWVWIPPGVLIILAVLAFNFIGDGLRDALDPRMKR